MAVLDENGVPIPDLNDSSREYVDGEHQKYLDTGDPEHLLTGTVAYVHNPRPIGLDGPDVTMFKIGGETLDEAIKTVIGTFDAFHAQPAGSPHLFEGPKWVASDNEHLARLLAEHYGAKVKALTSKELKP